MAGQIDCPAPLPEGPADALLVKMLTSAPYMVPEKIKKAKGTRKSSRRQASFDSPSMRRPHRLAARLPQL